MGKMKKYQITWYDKGNCEIAEVTVEAFTLVGAHVPAYNGLSRKNYKAVQKEAVSVEVKEI